MIFGTIEIISIHCKQMTKRLAYFYFYSLLLMHWDPPSIFLPYSMMYVFHLWSITCNIGVSCYGALLWQLGSMIALRYAVYGIPAWSEQFFSFQEPITYCENFDKTIMTRLYWETETNQYTIYDNMTGGERIFEKTDT